MVFTTAVRLLGNRSDAEDISQGVFLKAFERFEAIGESERAAGWLRTVTRHACLTHLTRYRARWRFFSELSGGGGDQADRDFDAPSQTETSPLVQLDLAGRRERVEQALLALPAHQRVPLVLFHTEEMNYQDIADALGVSLGKVKTDIHRGREALRKMLLSDAPE